MTDRRRFISLLLWVIACVATFVMWHQQRPELASLPGIVEAVPMPLGAIEPGRIATLHVVPGQTVAAGDPLVSFDTTAIDTELAVARAQLAEATAGQAAETTARDQESEQARLEAAARLDEANARITDLESRQAVVAAELKAARRELRRLKPLVDDGVAGFDRLGDLQGRIARLAKEAEHLPATLDEWKANQTRLQALVSAAEAADPAPAVAPTAARVVTEERRVEALLRRREAAVLRAPRDGRITRVLLGPGAAVTAGAPVVTMMPVKAERLVAWLPEATLRRVRTGDTVEVSPLDSAVAEPVIGRVEELGPGVIEMPRRLWNDPHNPTFGRPVHIRIAADARLLPDERVTVTVQREAPSGAIAASVASTVDLIDVPTALAERSRIEISGALWLPEQARFLVVSDDTGFKDRDDDAPWVFLVDKAGRMDPEPVVIAGVDAVSDLEAVTRDPDGRIYLLCSQSANKKGKRKTKRTLLVRARLDGGVLKADATIRLWRALDEDLRPDERAALGIDESLDIEGMTWFDGGLALGLKSPGQGPRARVWHLSSVDALFERGLGPSGAHLRPLMTLDLPIGPGANPGGISELMADGQGLYVLSTLPEGPASGAAWHLARPDAKPTLLATWLDRKPEGLARGPDGLRVFFDEGDRRPTWAPLPEAR